MPPSRGLKASAANVPAPEPAAEAGPAKPASVATTAKQMYESGKENAVRAQPPAARRRAASRGTFRHS